MLSWFQRYDIISVQYIFLRGYIHFLAGSKLTRGRPIFLETELSKPQPATWRRCGEKVKTVSHYHCLSTITLFLSTNLNFFHSLLLQSQLHDQSIYLYFFLSLSHPHSYWIFCIALRSLTHTHVHRIRTHIDIVGNTTNIMFYLNSPHKSVWTDE